MSLTPTPPPPGQRPAASVSTQAELARAKRKLAQLEGQLAQMTGHKRKNNSDINEGRGLCRLVSLFEALLSLIDEADRRLGIDDGDHEDEIDEEVDAVVAQERNRRYTSYILLLKAVPRVKVLLEEPGDGEAYSTLLSKLQHGANEARRDDIRRILRELPDWLNQDYAPRVPFSTKGRRDRGLQNDISGRLLCPIFHSWDNESVRNNIRSGRISIADDYYLSCFYPRGKGNAADVEAKFLRSQLLVKTYCAIFTSPSSAEAFAEEDENGPKRKKRKRDAQKKATKSTVAELIHMEGKVTPRSIAHAATMLAFNLTDCESWRESYNGFSYRGLYNFVIDFFEDVKDSITQGKVDQLLLWWNKQIFPDHITAITESQSSSIRLKEQRAQRAAAAAARIV